MPNGVARILVESLSEFHCPTQAGSRHFWKEKEAENGVSPILFYPENYFYLVFREKIFIKVKSVRKRGCVKKMRLV